MGLNALSFSDSRVLLMQVYSIGVQIPVAWLECNDRLWTRHRCRPFVLGHLVLNRDWGVRPLRRHIGTLASPMRELL